MLWRRLNTLMVDAVVDRLGLPSQQGHSSKEMTELYNGVPIEPKLRAMTALNALANGGRSDDGSG